MAYEARCCSFRSSGLGRSARLVVGQRRAGGCSCCWPSFSVRSSISAHTISAVRTACWHNISRDFFRHAASGGTVCRFYHYYCAGHAALATDA